MFFLYFRVDTLMLSFLKGGEATGLYGAAYNFVFGAAFVTYTLSRALLPRFAECDSMAALRRVYQRSLLVVALLTVGLTGLLLAGLPAFRALYGNGYDARRGPTCSSCWRRPASRLRT